MGLDIRQRVLSLPLIHAAEDKEVGPEVRRLLAGSLGDAEVSRVTELVRSSDALKRVGDEARALAEGRPGELEAIELTACAQPRSAWPGARLHETSYLPLPSGRG